MRKYLLVPILLSLLLTATLGAKSKAANATGNQISNLLNPKPLNIEGSDEVYGKIKINGLYYTAMCDCGGIILITKIRSLNYTNKIR